MPSFPQTVVNNLLFLTDTWQGPWRAAQHKGWGNFQGKIVTPLQFGVHVLYAYAGRPGCYLCQHGRT
jgi:hypothetical protein